MNKNLTEMIFILDMSGSMEPLTDDTIGGYNSLLKKQKESEGEANVTTVLFNDEYVLLHDHVPIQEANLISREEYIPCGMTAMLDAIGKTIDSTKARIKKMEEDEKPGTVIFSIITDGMENASWEYKLQAVQKLIKKQREKGWIFTFIGANIDNIQVSDDLGIDRSYSRSYTSSSAGTSSVYSSLSAAVSYSRSSAARTGSVDEAAIQSELDKIE